LRDERIKLWKLECWFCLFYDGVGNIVEFIVRYDLKMSIRIKIQIWCISNIVFEWKSECLLKNIAESKSKIRSAELTVLKGDLSILYKWNTRRIVFLLNNEMNGFQQT
jgi:hypothetical protein